MNKYFCFLLAFILALMACSSPSNTDQQPSINNRPNIILMMSDDQGWGDVGYNGHPHLKTPHLDQMAKDGVEFTRFYSASSVCSPTRGSVLTGRHPMRYGICHANCGHMLPEEITLAELVKEAGYTTGHFGKWHLGTLTRTEKDANRGGQPKHTEHYSPPWENGFDVCFSTESKVPTWDPMITPPRSTGDVKPSLEEGEYFGTAYWTNRSKYGAGERVEENLDGDDSRVIMDRVLPFIDKAVKDQQPFFSVVWFHTPHLPVLTGEKYREPYKDLSVDQQHYYGCLTAMDEQIGRLRTHLVNLGIDENTLLFFTSDNGPEGKEVGGRTQGMTKGLRGRKRSLHEGGVRVPGLMVWPERLEGGKVVDVPGYTSDYFPTVASILGMDITAFNRPYDGIDLQATLDHPELERYLPFQIKDQAALTGNRYKIYSNDAGKTFKLYDLEKDPAITTDIAAEHPKVFENLVRQWNIWKVSQEKSAVGQDYTTSQ